MAGMNIEMRRTRVRFMWSAKTGCCASVFHRVITGAGQDGQCRIAREARSVSDRRQRQKTLPRALSMRCAWRHVLHRPGQLTDMGAACLPSRSIDVRMPRRRQTPLSFQAQPHSSRPVVRAGWDRSIGGLPLVLPATLLPMQRGFVLLLSAALALGAIIPLVAPAPTRAAPTELFFSEYIEGTSNNKALEIFNGTGAPIDLAAEWLQHPDALQRQPAGDPDHQPDRERGQRRCLCRGTGVRRRGHPRPGRPDERVRLVQWRRRGRPAQGHDRARRHRPDRI